MAQGLPQVSPSKGIEQPKIVSILAKATVADLAALVQYAEQECNNESVTPENIESTKNYGDSAGD